MGIDLVVGVVQNAVDRHARVVSAQPRKANRCHHRRGKIRYTSSETGPENSITMGSRTAFFVGIVRT